MVADAIFENRAAPMGLRYERGAELSAVWREHAVATWIVPFGATVVDVAMQTGPSVLVDQRGVLMLPAGRRHRLTLRSAVVELCTLLFHPELRSLAVAEYAPKLDPQRLERICDEQVFWPRTTWLNELCHRYVFERVVCDRHASLAARFCEIELTKELHYFECEREQRRVRRHLLDRPHDLTARAIEQLEAHLFEPFDGAALARQCGSSASTLLRAFRRDVGMAPSEYVRRRRLDEAMLLLKGGRYAVTDVASMVGYQTVAAFSHAFHRHFGQTPSAVKQA